MITYILDALRYREGTFGAVWLTLGAANLSLLISGASFSRSRSIPLGIFIAASNGSLLFLTGESRGVGLEWSHWHPHFLWVGLLCTMCLGGFNGAESNLLI